MIGPPEQIFESSRVNNWAGALDTIQSYGPAHLSDPVFAEAVRTFVKTFLQSLSGPSFPSKQDATVSERMLLFHSAGRLHLEHDALQMLVHRSLLYWDADGDRRVGLARLLPEDAVCQMILREHTPTTIESAGTMLTEVAIPQRARGIRSAALLQLFKSRQEEEFYHAVRSFYPQHLLGVNVSIHAVIDLDLVRNRLSKQEASFFFRGLLDIVTFDPEHGHRPVIAFEVDSPLHDDENQISRDRKKDRILATAGLRLVRIRPDRSQTNRRQFLALLRNAEIEE